MTPFRPTLPPRPKLDIRFFVYTPDSHDLYGPFLSEANARAFAAQRGLSSFSIEPSNKIEAYMLTSLHVVTEKRKGTKP